MGFVSRIKLATRAFLVRSLHLNARGSTLVDGQLAVDPELWVAPNFAAGHDYRVKTFERLIRDVSPTLKSCLQIGLGRPWTAGFGPNWIVVDLYDMSPGVHYHYDAADLPSDWADKFDLIVCNAVLEHVPDPVKVISELHRVLKKGGMIWVEVPFAQPFHCRADYVGGKDSYNMGGDYWRVTTMGMRIWMKTFEEIRCDWAIGGVVFFFGRK